MHKAGGYKGHGKRTNKIQPQFAFYILANAKAFCRNNSFDFCLKVLEKTGVAITPGIDFGKNAEGYVRFSYANSLENIAEGMDRLEEYLKTAKGIF